MNDLSIEVKTYPTERLTQPGTYLYHGHYGMQATAGFFGMIQVSLPDGVVEPFSYDFDRSIILTDWYHKSPFEQATGLASIPFGWVGEPNVRTLFLT